MEEKFKNRTEYTKALLKQYFTREKELSEQQKKLLLALASKCIKENSPLFELFLAMQNKETTFERRESEFTYLYESGTCTINYKEQTMTIEYKTLKNVVAKLVDLTEDTLPLGTLVQLKKEYFQKICDVNKIDKAWAVITYRYLKKDEKSFFTYGGVIYPVSNFNHPQILQFTPSLIDKVIQRGYSDEQEEAYIYLMKNELTIENGQISAGLELGEGKDE